MKPLRTYAAELRTALEFLTILPFKARPEAQPAAIAEAGGQPESWKLGQAAGWFPWVGLVTGLVISGVWWLGGTLFPALITATLVVAAWVVISGGLHLDGLADCCDGFFNASSPERRLEIMRDPRLGAFGAMGVLLVLALKIAAVYSLPPQSAVPALLLAACSSRGLILLSLRQPVARPGGMGGNFRAGLRHACLPLAIIPVAGLGILLGWRGVSALAAALLTAWGIFLLARRRIGGVTGDVLGLLVEAGELAVLMAYNLRLPA